MVSAVYAYWTVRGWTLDATLVIAITFLGTAVVATILPWYKPTSSTTRRWRTTEARIPWSASPALVTVIILGWTIYLWLSDPLYGIGVGNTDSIKFLGALYGLGALVYVAAWFYRRSQGVDLGKIHSEIPAE